MRFHGISQIPKMLLDAGIVGAAFCLAFLARFEGDLPDPFAEVLFLCLPYVVAMKVALLFGARRYQTTWRYTNLREIWRILTGQAAVAILLVTWRQMAWSDGAAIPLGVILLDLLLSFVGLVGVRVLARHLHEQRDRNSVARSTMDPVPTLLIGAGRAGAMLAKEILASSNTDIDILGFVDDDESLRGMRVEGLLVLGNTTELRMIAHRSGARQAIISIANTSNELIRRITHLCEASGLITKIIPPLHEIVSGQAEVSKIREVSINDLLRRSPVMLDGKDIERIVRGETVLVTGAGGSIGSELCRTIARLRPAALIMVEQAENSLFYIHRELLEKHPDLDLVPCIADICDEGRMSAIFAEYRPSQVLHAAAHKHVPMMECNAGEAVKNNVVGTRNIASLADVWRAQRFVMISTDKAVNPTSVMGVSKRVAELMIQALGQRSTTRFMTVRFGNVLGSAGSVIPIFQQQIAQGGPVTVTHPEMKRFFMTIPEACQLVLQASAMGKGGELFVLDMGEPVKIVDLARDLIRLSGLVPDRDIAIRFTGLRPGEKLYEELSHREEDLLKTAHPRIFIGKVKAPKLVWISRLIDDLEELAAVHEIKKIYAKFKQIVPEYQKCQSTQVLRLDPPVPVAVGRAHELREPSLQ